MEFGPAHLWESMGTIAKVVVIVLLLQSIYSLYVTIERWLFYRKAKKQSLEFAKQASDLCTGVYSSPSSRLAREPS